MRRPLAKGRCSMSCRTIWPTRSGWLISCKNSSGTSLFPLGVAAVTILISACTPNVVGQSSSGLSPYQAGSETTDRITAEYQGYYACIQGLTALSLQFVGPINDSRQTAIFKFGPTLHNQGVPVGAFIVRGTLYLQSGELDLRPVSWLSQPPGFVMVGLSGRSNDGGHTFEGDVLSGLNCTKFSIHRTR